MRARTFGRKASPAKAVSVSPSLGSRSRPFLPARAEGGIDLESWLESARRLGHNLDHLRLSSGPDRDEAAHAPGCACAACTGGSEAMPGLSPAGPGPGGGESRGTIQLCKHCADSDCKYGEKCGHTYSLDEAPKIWKPDIKKSIKIQTTYGLVSARQNRKAPYIQTRDKDYNNQKAKVDYKDFNRALRGDSTSSENDAKIAQDLLDKKSDFIKSDLQKRGGAQREATVSLAEGWRKKGALKIDRANLRRVSTGEIDLDKANEQFAYVKSADEGRKQVGRIQDVLEGRKKREDLPDYEQKILDNLSPLREHDFSSEDEERETKNKDVAKRRLFSKKHEESEGTRVKEKKTSTPRKSRSKKTSEKKEKKSSKRKRSSSDTKRAEKKREIKKKKK